MDIYAKISLEENGIPEWIIYTNGEIERNPSGRDCLNALCDEQYDVEALQFFYDDYAEDCLSTASDEVVLNVVNEATCDGSWTSEYLPAFLSVIRIVKQTPPFTEKWGEAEEEYGIEDGMPQDFPLYGKQIYFVEFCVQNPYEKITESSDASND
ncbi:MAG: hypothetical protein HUK22_08020 [Thermoguttaceae bacterium]|nr:hypothetical protein [Thermoguttaceae bacterium]